MSQLSLPYLLENKSWLNYKSLASYIQAGLTLLAVILLIIFKNLLLNRLGNFIPFDIGPVVNTVLIAIMIGSLLSTALDVYTGNQFAKIFKATLPLQTDSSLKEHEVVLNEYQTFFRYYGILSIIQAVIMVLVFASVAGTLIAFILTHLNHNQPIENCGFSAPGTSNCAYNFN